MKIYVICCSSALNPDELRLDGNGDEIITVPLPCSGKIDIVYITKAFETGADGVALVTCQRGECRFLEGNLRARKRAELVDGLLEEIGVGKGRTIVIQTDGDLEKVIKELNSFRRIIDALPIEVLSQV